MALSCSSTLAFPACFGYKKNTYSPSPSSVHRIRASKDSENVKRALENAREYKKNKKINIPKPSYDDKRSDPIQQVEISNKEQREGELDKETDPTIVKIYTRDGVITREITPSDEDVSEIKSYVTKGFSVSETDFIGLDFSDKKSKRQLPRGLNTIVESFSPEQLSDVQMIAGDVTKFGDKAVSTDSTNPRLYKPKVTTWGVFPRPKDISKTYGGGKTIRPGDALESEEEKATSEARTKKLIDKYKEQLGLKVDPKVQEECEKAFQEGKQLMDGGRLFDATQCFEKIMKNMVFKTDLYGLSALQWSICLDSLNRFEEAQAMYKKLGSHPNASVNRKAKQLIFGFKAMEKLKVSAASTPSVSVKNYFNLLPNEYDNAYFEEGNEIKETNMLGQSIPYIIFLLSPVFFLLAVIVKKGV